jgi:predicted nucleic acid-binding protein
VISRRVVNASPLIYLTHVGLLEVLDEPGVPVAVPDRVLAEIGVRGASDPAMIAVGAAPWIQIVPTPAIPKDVSDWGLDPGESAVLALALEQPGSQAILDDLDARRCAASLGISTQGTLGLLVVAKRLGLIAEVRPLIDQLRRAGFYLSQKLAERVLRAAGE